MKGDVYSGKKLRRKASLSSKIGDTLNLSENPTVNAALRAAGETTVLFSARVIKVNRRLKLQERTVALTEHSLYNFKDETCKTLLRRIDYKDIGSIAVSPYKDNYFVLRVPYEKRADYVLLSKEKTEIISTILREARNYIDHDIPLEIQSEIPYRLCTGDINVLMFSDSGEEEFQGLRLDKEGQRRIVKLPVVVSGDGDSTSSDEEMHSAEAKEDFGSADQDMDDGSGSMATPMKAVKERKAEVLFDYEACSPNEMTLQRGQIVRILDEHDDGWWVGVVEGTNKPPGLFPSNYTAVMESSPAGKSVQKRVRALFDYTALSNAEMSFKKGQIIDVVEETEDRWWLGALEDSNDDPKLFPSNYTTTIT